MGLTIDYLYSLTPRQFYNIQKGWNEKRDGESKERILLARKIMYASIMPHTKHLTENDVWPLDFLNLPEEEERNDEQLAKDLEDSLAFWARVDEHRAKA